MENTGLGDKVADFIVKVNYQGIPLDVINKAKQCVLDTLGVTILGSGYPASRILGNVVNHYHGRKESVIIGTSFKAPSFLAALTNGVSAHAADYDDTSVEFKGHPSCVLVPSVLAAGESVGASGREVLLGLVVGNEVGSKLGESMGNGHYRKGWHGTGTIGTVAAAAAVAKVLKLDHKQIMNAIGLAASSASGIRQNFGTMTKSWHAGHAAKAGILSVVMAKEGFDASAEALDGKSGFITTFNGKKDLSSFENLGSPYSLLRVICKKYPSCAATHPAVEAILKHIDDHAITPENVDFIECHGSPTGLAAFNSGYPKTELEAKFNLEYCVAATLVNGRLGMAEFEDEVLENSDIRNVWQNIKVFSDETLEDVALSNKVLAPTRVKVKTKDGQEFVETILAAHGGPNDPLTWSELEDKFRECSEGLVPSSRINEITSLIHHFESIENINDLMVLFQT